MLSKICEMHSLENGPCDEVQTSGFWGCISIPSLLGLVYSCPTTVFEWSRGCHQRAPILPFFIFVLFNGFATTFRNLRGHHQSGLMIFEDLERLLERVEACYVFCAFMVVRMVVEYLTFN